jgi:hypothetical protein
MGSSFDKPTVISTIHRREKDNIIYRMSMLYHIMVGGCAIDRFKLTSIERISLESEAVKQEEVGVTLFSVADVNLQNSINIGIE